MLQTRIRENRTYSTSFVGGPSLPAVHVMAEQELLIKLVDKLEDVLDLARELFGAAAWLEVPPSRPASVVNSPTDEGGHEMGWYSTVSSKV
jgi:hypothetical protein